MKQNYIEYCPKHANTQSSTNLSKFKTLSEDYSNDIISFNKKKNFYSNQSNNGQKFNQRISKSSSFSLLFKNKENFLQRQFSENAYVQNNYSKEKKNIKNSSLQHSMSMNLSSNSNQKLLETNCPKHSKILPESTFNKIDNQYKNEKFKKNFIDKSIQTDVFLSQNYSPEIDNFYKQKNLSDLDDKLFYKTSINQNEYSLFDNPSQEFNNSNLTNYNQSLYYNNSNLNDNYDKNLINSNITIHNIDNYNNQCSLKKHKSKTEFYKKIDLRSNQFFNNDYTSCNLGYYFKDENFSEKNSDFLINFNDCERNNYENENYIIDNQNIEKIKKIKELNCEEIECEFNKKKTTDSIFFPLKKNNETQYQNKSFENIVHKDENYMYLLDKYEKNSDQKAFNSTYSSIYKEVTNNLNSEKCSIHQHRFELANNEIPENFSFQINKKNNLSLLNNENFFIPTKNFKNYDVSKINEQFFENIENLDNSSIQPVFCDNYLTYQKRKFSEINQNSNCDLRTINETKSVKNQEKKTNFYNRKSKKKFFNLFKNKKPINLTTDNNLSSFINVSFKNLNQFGKKLKSNKKNMPELQSTKKLIKRKHIKKGGIKSKPIKSITHPLERSLIGFFLITLFFTILAIISGLPIVSILCLCLPFAACIRNLASCDFCVNMFLNYQKCTPSEIYWINSPWKNNCKKGQAVCLIMVDDGFTLEQCRDLIQSRLINKIGTERFRWLLRFKGLFKLPYWKRIPINEFLIDDHITELKPINSISKLKEYIIKIMHVKLNLISEPGWHIHYVHMPNQNQVALIIQFHQALFDGINLSKILISLICDQATVFPLTEQPNFNKDFEKIPNQINKNTFNNLSFNDSIYPQLKPRFGGFNFSVNICRAVIVGPLTFILWLIWAITRRNSNFLNSSKFFLNLNKFVDSIKINLISKCYDENNSEKYDNDVLKQKNNYEKIKKNVKNLPENNTETVNKEKKYSNENPEETIHWISYPFSKVQRIKQVTRSSLNDVILSCIAGAVRTYLIKNCNLFNPPDLCVSLPVDISVANDNDMENIGVNYVFLTAPLPTSVESSIPRLWEIRHLMEELKTSADPAVMVGVNFFLHWLLPSFLSKFILNFIHRNSSVCLSNLQGPKNPITFYTNRVHSIHYWMSPPPNIPLCFNVFSYGESLEISISSSASLFPSAEKLAILLDKQFQIYFKLLGKRRIPGEHSKIKTFTKNYMKNSSQNAMNSSNQKTQESILSKIKEDLNVSLININEKYKTSSDSLNSISLPIPDLNEKNCLISQLEELNFYSKRPTLTSVNHLTIGQLADELDYIQTQICEISAQIKMVNDINRKNQLELELRELRDSFTILMRYVKRRKSFADHSLHNVAIKVEEDIDDEIENDGGLRLMKKRFSFGVSSRRSSVVSTSVISIPSTRFQVSPPNLLSRRSLIPTSSPDSISSQEHSMKEETV